MAVHHITVTLGAAAAAISTPAAGTPSIGCRELQIESETGNGTVYVGDSTVTTTNYGRTVLAGSAAAITLRPADGISSINLASTYLLGTNTQKVHCLYIS